MPPDLSAAEVEDLVGSRRPVRSIEEVFPFAIVLMGRATVSPRSHQTPYLGSWMLMSRSRKSSSNFFGKT